jgi:hypothetical protein
LLKRPLFQQCAQELGEHTRRKQQTGILVAQFLYRRPDNRAHRVKVGQNDRPVKEQPVYSV